MTDAEMRNARVRSPQAAHSASRRAWLAGACACAAALAAGVAGRIAAAWADTRPPAGGGFDAFIALSQKLTGRTRFDSVLGKRAYDALSKADNQFTQNIATLNSWLLSHGGVPSDTVIAALQADTPVLARTVTAVVRAWYLGLVGDPPHVQVIAYESALMFDPVNDVLTVPSYCRDIPFYWSQKPTNA
ncbi:sugar dehydrogenase complex small subunit [Paraburkholderia humisilvae]|uniref:Fructose dehydrogenase small subunit n=1 Tax=Paraburkholderia humisilvae TaxID=627669 RepID=A0A6J5EUQ1_9BURK|nr:sugar dehydrogenase complex small subunit [Paraburkholderia humisilvae]CAB3770279.1 Fructose dehydrogenase small subunit [Paraburkholderia humisilvae]